MSTKTATIPMHFQTLNLETEGDLGRVLDLCRQDGWKVTRSHYMPSYFDKVWEHPTIAKHNDGLSQAAILSSYFCTLYHDPDDDEYQFAFGRIGNTTEWRITRGETS